MKRTLATVALALITLTACSSEPAPDEEAYLQWLQAYDLNPDWTDDDWLEAGYTVCEDAKGDDKAQRDRVLSLVDDAVRGPMSLAYEFLCPL